MAEEAPEVIEVVTEEEVMETIDHTPKEDKEEVVEVKTTVATLNQKLKQPQQIKPKNDDDHRDVKIKMIKSQHSLIY